MTEPNPSATDAAIMKLLSVGNLTYWGIKAKFPVDVEPEWIEDAMKRLERCGAIRLNRRSGKYERYD